MRHVSHDQMTWVKLMMVALTHWSIQHVENKHHTQERKKHRRKERHKERTVETGQR